MIFTLQRMYNFISNMQIILHSDYEKKMELNELLMRTQHQNIDFVLNVQKQYTVFMQSHISRMLPRCQPRNNDVVEYYDMQVRPKMFEVRNQTCLLNRLVSIYIPLYDYLVHQRQLSDCVLLARLQPCQAFTDCLKVMDNGFQSIVNEYKQCLRVLFTNPETNSLEKPNSVDTLDALIGNSAKKQCFSEPQMYVAPLRCSLEEFSEFMCNYTQTTSKFIPLCKYVGVLTKLYR